MENTRDTQAAFLTFIAGATVGVGVALLLKSKSGKEVQKKFGAVTGTAVRKLKYGVREAKFKMSPKTPAGAHTFDGGGSFV